MKKILSLVVLGAPSLAFAQASVDSSYFTNILTTVQNILNSIVPIVIGIVVILFLWEGYKYFRAGADDKAEIRNKMLEGIVIIAVMVSLWGLVALVKRIAGVSGTSSAASQIDTLLPPRQ